MRTIPLLLLLAACPPSPSVIDGGATLQHHTDLAHNHLPTCSDPGCGEAANPPLGGPHCPSTSPCRVFDAGVSRCNWVHNLEHGHVVLAYNCPDGCPEIVDGLTSIWQDARIAGNSRVLITPDPLLPNKVAAIVWGWGWVGDTVDVPAIEQLMSHQDQEAPESGLGCAQ